MNISKEAEEINNENDINQNNTCSYTSLVNKYNNKFKYSNNITTTTHLTIERMEKLINEINEIEVTDENNKNNNTNKNNSNNKKDKKRIKFNNYNLNIINNNKSSTSPLIEEEENLTPNALSIEEIHRFQNSLKNLPTPTFMDGLITPPTTPPGIERVLRRKNKVNYMNDIVPRKLDFSNYGV